MFDKTFLPQSATLTAPPEEEPTLKANFIKLFNALQRKATLHFSLFSQKTAFPYNKGRHGKYKFLRYFFVCWVGP